MVDTEKCFKQKLYNFEGDIKKYHLFDLGWRHEGQVKVNFVFLNENLNFLLRYHILHQKTNNFCLNHFFIQPSFFKIFREIATKLLTFSNFLLEFYQLCRKIVGDKNYLFSSHRALRIFSEFFITF